MPKHNTILGSFLRRVCIRNYKSIGNCHVKMAALSVLVGRNGSGKSNFLDALSFLADGLKSSLDNAIKARGGIDDVRRRSTGHPRNFRIELELVLPKWQLATYGFEIAAAKKGAFEVKEEDLQIRDKKNQVTAAYRREKGEVVSATLENMPPVREDRLYLSNAAGLPEFRTTYDALLSMGFYNLNPESMKELRNPDVGELLDRDGGNIASVIARLSQAGAEDRLRSFLAEIVPGITKVERIALGPKETLRFWQRVKGSKYPWKFYANSMSDGTLRALGALVAVAQLADREHPVRLVGIEEPETALHPAASGALMDALREAAVHTQIIVTSHSPDFLDQVDTEEDELLVVESRDGTTVIADADSSSLEMIKDHLYTPGELLRMDQLQPDEASIQRQLQQLSLFSRSGDTP